jgi:hypothetical protein
MSGSLTGAVPIPQSRGKKSRRVNEIFQTMPKPRNPERTSRQTTPRLFSTNATPTDRTLLRFWRVREHGRGGMLRLPRLVLRPIHFVRRVWLLSSHIAPITPSGNGREPRYACIRRRMPRQRRLPWRVIMETPQHRMTEDKNPALTRRQHGLVDGRAGFLPRSTSRWFAASWGRTGSRAVASITNAGIAPPAACRSSTLAPPRRDAPPRCHGSPYHRPSALPSRTGG